MGLSPREREILALLRAHPTLDAAGLARALGTSKGAVAVALSSLAQKGEIIGRGYLLRGEPGAVVLGGAVWDIKARSTAAITLHTSNPSTATRTPGGVGRNIAENLARLGGRVQLLAAVGGDEAGRELLARTAEAGVDVGHVIISPHPTGSYLAALDIDGELVVGLSDMAATDALDVIALARYQDCIAQAGVVVVDGNLSAPVIEWALIVAAHAGVPVVVEPVSVAKATRLAPVLGPARPVFAIKPNLDELGALTAGPVADNQEAIIAAAAILLDRGVSHVWVSRGARGSLLIGPDGTVATEPAGGEVVDVTGAGDAMTAGFVHALLGGADPASAVRRGQVAAELTVASNQTVRPDLGAAFARALSNNDSQGESR
jgi:pseudouridine kinase